MNEIDERDCVPDNPEELKKAYRELEESKAFLEHFVKAYSSAYKVNLKDDTYEILHMNSSFKQVFTMNGVRRDMERFIREHVHPDDRLMVSRMTDSNYIRKRLKEEDEISFMIREQYDGQERIMHAVIMRGADPDHAAIGFMDVTSELLKEKETNEKLEAAYKEVENYRNAVLGQALIAFTANLSRNELVSGFWVDDTGLPISLMEILGMDIPCSYDEYITAWNRKYVKSDSENKFEKMTDRSILLEEFETGKREIAFDYRADTISGNERYLRRVISLSRDDDTGDIIAYTNVKDVTQEKENEKLLEEAMIAAQNANQAKSTFLFNMSHDIRTPMNAIIGFSGMAEKYIDDKNKVLDCLGKVRVAGEHLLSLINDVLDMSRVESGQVKPEEQVTCIDASMDNMISIIGANASDRNITLSAGITPEVVHHWVYSDRLRMMRVFTNIISNSVKYTEPGGKIWFTIDELPCERKNYANYRFTIEDTGIGMSAEYLKHLFEPFSRAESSTKSGVVGTGLGMAITKSLVELMGGTIAVESELGKGTKVTIDISHKIAEPVEAKATLEGIYEQKLEGKRILLVEDNELNREIALDLLQEQGCITDYAEDGNIAVDKVKNSKPGQYDLVLMDIQMPAMNGYDATRAIRNLPDKKVAMIPIVAMTANAFEEDKRNAFAAGMNGHISKPVNAAALIKTLAEIAEQTAKENI